MKIWKRIKGLVVIALSIPLLWAGVAHADAIDEGRMYITEAGGTITLGCKAPCKVKLPSTTGGADVVLDISANTYTYTDGGTAGASNMTDIGFGLTETVDWAEDRPLFHYLVNEDNAKANVGWFVSLVADLTVTPGVTYIHDKDAAAANDTQDSIFGAWSDDAGKAGKPCRMIGATRVQFDTTATVDAYVTQTLGNTDGIGDDRIQKTYATKWTGVKLQNGATLNFLSEGAVAATTLAFEGSSMSYWVNGRNVTVRFACGTRSAADATAVAVNLHLPYVATSTAMTGFDRTIYNNGTDIAGGWRTIAGSAYAQVYTAGGVLYCSSFTGAGDHIPGKDGVWLHYKM